MKKIVFVTIVCVFLAGPAMAAHMGTVTLKGLDKGFSVSGIGWAGDVKITTTGLGATAGDNQPFRTFCVELAEHVTVGQLYAADVSIEAINGGKNTGPTGPTGHDALDPRSAYLYDRYLNLVNPANADARDTQLAIWVIEEELAPGNPAVTAEAAALVAASAGQWGSIREYRVANLYDMTTDALKQDLLVKVVPLPASVLLGVFAVGLASRKLRKFA